MSIRQALFETHIRPLAPIPSGVAPDLSGMRPFAAMLVDIYGTLLISGAGEIGCQAGASRHRVALADLVRQWGIGWDPDRLVGRLHRAIAGAHVAARCQGIEHPEVNIVHIWQQVLGWSDTARIKALALAYELIVNPVYPMPSLRRFLAAGQARSMPMGIISNAQFYTIWTLEHLLGGSLATCGFDPGLLFFSWRAGQAKPSTLMFARAKAQLDKMGIRPASVLYLGNDMRNDIMPAAALGFKTALFAGDRRSLRRRRADHGCRHLRPDLTVTDLGQLITGGPTS